MTSPATLADAHTRLQEQLSEARAEAASWRIKLRAAETELTETRQALWNLLHGAEVQLVRRTYMPDSPAQLAHTVQPTEHTLTN